MQYIYHSSIVIIIIILCYARIIKYYNILLSLKYLFNFLIFLNYLGTYLNLHKINKFSYNNIDDKIKLNNYIILL